MPGGVQSALRRYMPAGQGLQRYEWRKHGTCSGLSSEAYFSAMARLGRQANETIGAVLQERHMLGQTVQINDLLSAVAGRDPALAQAMVVSCRMPRGGGAALIEEIRVTLSKDFHPVPTTDVGLGQNSGCPDGAGLVPTVQG